VRDNGGGSRPIPSWMVGVVKGWWMRDEKESRRRIQTESNNYAASSAGEGTRVATEGTKRKARKRGKDVKKSNRHKKSIGLTGGKEGFESQM